MRIVCLGDSLTSGYSQGEDKYPYGAILQKLLDKEVGKGKHEVITCGNNGETAVSMAKRYAVTTEIAERRRLPPKLFIIMAGTNDLLAYPVIEEDKIVGALAAIVREASEAEATRAAARAMLVGGAVRAPVTNGRARMGTWQGLYLCEHGARGEHARDVLAVCDAREATARTTIVVSAGKRGLRDITDDVTAAIRDAHRPGTIGTLHCFCEHTSASLVVGPSDPTFATRFEDALNDIVPESWNDEFFRHTAEGPDDMPAHVKSTIVGAHKTVPVDADGTLSPLNGQRLYLCEHRNVGGFNSGLARRVTLTLQCD